MTEILPENDYTGAIQDTDNLADESSYRNNRTLAGCRLNGHHIVGYRGVYFAADDSR